MLGRVKVDLAAEAISRPVECSEAAEKGVKEGRKVGQLARAFQTTAFPAKLNQVFSVFALNGSHASTSLQKLMS